MAGSPVSQGMPKNGGRDNALGVRRHDTKPRDRSRSSEDVRLSKQMSKTLRHKPPSCMDSSGWVPLHELVTHIGTAKSAEHILRVVASDVKGRFEVCECLTSRYVTVPVAVATSRSWHGSQLPVFFHHKCTTVEPRPYPFQSTSGCLHAF